MVTKIMSDLTDKILTGKRPLVLIFLFAFFVHFRSLFFGFTYFDDNVLILDNLFFLKSLANLSRAFTTEVFHLLHASAAYYRPILTISFMFDALISGESPFFYHLTNVLIHCFASVAVYVFLVKLHQRKDLSLFFALVFASHPILTQAVAWLPGRNDSLLALFVLASFIALQFYFENKNGVFIWLHFFSFFLALFTKESAIFVPFLIIVYSLFFLKEKKFLARVWPVLFLGWGVIFITWIYLRSIALSGSPLGSYNPVDLFKAIFTNSPAIILYLGKVILPFNLSTLPTLVDSTLVYGWIGLLLILVLVLVSKNKDWKMMVFGLGWFLAFLLPSFIRVGGFVPDFLEHRIYLPLIGLFLFFASLFPFQNFNLKKAEFFYPACFLILVLASFTFIQSGYFRDKISYWSSAVKTSPHHPLAHRNLGAMYYLDGRQNEAEKEFLEALKINPNEEMAHNNLGLIYMARRDYEKAQKEFEKELAINPGYDKALFNLGLLYWQEGKKDEAAQEWLEVLKVNPDHVDALVGLANYYNEVGDFEKANYYAGEAKLRGAK